MTAYFSSETIKTRRKENNTLNALKGKNHKHRTLCPEKRPSVIKTTGDTLRRRKAKRTAGKAALARPERVPDRWGPLQSDWGCQDEGGRQTR